MKIVYHSTNKKTDLYGLTQEDLGNMLFCLSEVARNPENTHKNRTEAQELYKKIEDSLKEATVV